MPLFYFNQILHWLVGFEGNFWFSKSRILFLRYVRNILARNLDSHVVEADTNVGGMGQSNLMAVGVDGSNVAVGGGHGSNVAVGGGDGGNMLVGGSDGSNVLVGGGDGDNVLVGGSDGGNVAVGRGDRGNVVVGGNGRDMAVGVVDREVGVLGISLGLSLGLTLDNVLHWPVLGDVLGSEHTVGVGGELLGIVVVGDVVGGQGGHGGVSAVGSRHESLQQGGSDSADHRGSDGPDGGQQVVSVGVGGLRVGVGPGRLVVRSEGLGLGLGIALRHVVGGVAVGEGVAVKVAVGEVGGVREGPVVGGSVGCRCGVGVELRVGFRLGGRGGDQSENYKLHHLAH